MGNFCKAVRILAWFSSWGMDAEAEVSGVLHVKEIQNE